MASDTPTNDLADEAASPDGYFSEEPLEPEPSYPPLDETFDRCVVISNLSTLPESKYNKLSKVMLKLLLRISNLAGPANED